MPPSRPSGKSRKADSLSLLSTRHTVCVGFFIDNIYKSFKYVLYYSLYLFPVFCYNKFRIQNFAFTEGVLMRKHDQTPASGPSTGGMEELKRRDDALFDALGKSKKAKKRKLLRTVLVILIIVAVVLIAAVSILRRQVRDRFAAFDTDILSEAAKTGTISTVVSGTGTLTNVDAETVSVPTGLELTEILVENGDAVAEGQLLALADMATVRSAMAKLQEEIKDLDGQISDAEGDKADTYISAGVAGRVKAVYAEPGEDVAQVMIEHGALAVLSLDGYMAVDIETDVLAESDGVIVTREDGTTVNGSVESLVGDTATVLITDNGPLPDETVSVSTSDGTVIAEGVLYIHKPLMVTGYTGTVRSVHAKQNASVARNSGLFTLADTEYSANYDTLLRARKESEETLLELLNIQKHGGITAPVSGSVYNVADLDSSDIITDLLTLSPDVQMSVTISVDESDILSLKLDQHADVTVGSVSEDTIAGVVTEIDKTASDGSYTAMITLDKLSGMLPGMTADVDIRIQGVENAILVPVDAVHYTSTGAYVYTAFDTETQQYSGRVDVTVGLTGSDYVEITSGLAEGDVVYYTESESLYDLFSAMGAMGGRGNMGQMPAGNMGGGSGQMPQGGMPGGRG